MTSGGEPEEFPPLVELLRRNDGLFAPPPEALLSANGGAAVADGASAAFGSPASTAAVRERLATLLGTFGGHVTTSFDAYAARITRYGRFPPEVGVLAVALLRQLRSQLARQTRGVLRALPACAQHRLLLTACVLAVKLGVDHYETMNFYALVGGVPVGELRAMELTLLALLDFDLRVRRASFDCALVGAPLDPDTSSSSGDEGEEEEEEGCDDTAGSDGCDAARATPLRQRRRCQRRRRRQREREQRDGGGVSGSGARWRDADAGVSALRAWTVAPNAVATAADGDRAATSDAQNHTRPDVTPLGRGGLFLASSSALMQSPAPLAAATAAASGCSSREVSPSKAAAAAAGVRVRPHPLPPPAAFGAAAALSSSCGALLAPTAGAEGGSVSSAGASDAEGGGGCGNSSGSSLGAGLPPPSAPPPVERRPPRRRVDGVAIGENDGDDDGGGGGGGGGMASRSAPPTRNSSWCRASECAAGLPRASRHLTVNVHPPSALPSPPHPSATSPRAAAPAAPHDDHGVPMPFISPPRDLLERRQKAAAAATAATAAAAAATAAAA